MKSLKFKRLLVISHSNKKAGIFEFNPRLNLIVGNDNSIGKSSLVKLPLWTLGCEPTFDVTWTSLDCVSVLEFSVGSRECSVKRYKNLMTVIDSGKEHVFTKITGDYAEWFADVVGFSAKLANQTTGKPETPPPAYYFVPFYIDQKRSWANAWDNFQNLTQYSKWKPTIMKAHIGLLDPEYFTFEEEKYSIGIQRTEEDASIKRYKATSEVVSRFIPETYLAISNEQLGTISQTIREDLFELAKEQEVLLDNLAHYEDELAYVSHQLRITDEILKESQDDYEYATHVLEQDELECPLCGTLHSNSLINRASLLVDTHQAQRQKADLTRTLDRTQKALERTNTQLTKLRAKMDKMNSQYLLDVGGSQLTFSNVVEGVAGQSIKRQVEVEQGKSEVNYRRLSSDLRKVKAQQKQLEAQDTSTIEGDFMGTWQEYMVRLAATAVNTSDIKSILDYNKVVNSGGAAEGTRAILAYYLAVYKMISRNPHEATAPLIVDTPNQQEQSTTNYSKILDLVTSEAREGAQLFICAMDTDQIAPHKSAAKVFSMTAEKLLRAADYEKVQAAIEQIKPSEGLSPKG